MLLESVRSFFFSGRAADELPRLREAALFGLSELRGSRRKEGRGDVGYGSIGRHSEWAGLGLGVIKLYYINV